MLMIDGLLSKTVKRGFEFTLMVVGESGLGKSTMINSLFLTELYRNRTLPPVQVIIILCFLLSHARQIGEVGENDRNRKDHAGYRGSRGEAQIDDRGHTGVRRRA